MSAVSTYDTADIRAEKAFAAWIRGYRDPRSDDPTIGDDARLDCILPGDLEGLNVYEGRSTATRMAPAVVVMAANPARLYDEADWYSMTVTIELHTNRNESENGTLKAEAMHARRVKALDDMICRESLIMAGINKPEPPETDGRDVPGITIMGAFHEPGVADIVGQSFMQRWEIQIVMAPWDKL